MQRQEILAKFLQMNCKNEQDSHLCGLIAIQLVKRRRSRNPNPQALDRRDHCASFRYKVRFGAQETEVCFKAFLSIHGISKWRVRRLQQSLVNTSQAPTDCRGKHDNRPKQYPEVVINLVDNHIRSFPARKSHYSLRHNPDKRYLPEDLSVTKMHSLFLEQYHINVPYKIYWGVLKKYNISFGYPRSDTCSYCDSMELKIKTAMTDEQKQQLRNEKTLHLKKAEAFKEDKKAYKAKAQMGEILCLSFDFMQNLPLPYIKTNAVFYARQLWQFVFGIHDLGSEVVTIYSYCEYIAKKGSNEVTSMLLDYLKNISPEGRPSELVLISDGCPGQNKNMTMVRFLYTLIHVFKMFEKITYLFPVRGHSYLPNDQDFSLIEIKKRRLPCAEVPEDWDRVILSARQKPSPFKLRNLSTFDVKNIKKSTEAYFLKTPKPPLKLKNIRMLQFNGNDPFVKCRHSYRGPWQTSIVRNKKELSEVLTLDCLYIEPPCIAPAKLKDIKSLIPYLGNPESVNFYRKLFEDQSGGNEVVTDQTLDFDLDNDDNSSGCED